VKGAEQLETSERENPIWSSTGSPAFAMKWAKNSGAAGDGDELTDFVQVLAARVDLNAR
jgi:hypothetical protein